ncbi:MAG TPA: hypothetical protein VK563_17455 [Puia sp.]|nr:hypothetical protein [Puia sp.]
MKIWEFIKEHYILIAKTYGVDPAVFIGIHIVVTPIFILSVSWLVRNYRQKKNTVLPALVTIALYNIANVYVIVYGKSIPWYIYAIIAASTLLTGYFSIVSIRNKMQSE